MYADDLLGCDVTEHGDFGLGGGFEGLLDNQSAGDLHAILWDKLCSVEGLRKH